MFHTGIRTAKSPQGPLDPGRFMPAPPPPHPEHFWQCCMKLRGCWCSIPPQHPSLPEPPCNQPGPTERFTFPQTLTHASVRRSNMQQTPGGGEHFSSSPLKGPTAAPLVGTGLRCPCWPQVGNVGSHGRCPAYTATAEQDAESVMD